MEISIAAEKIFSLFGLPITNSILTTWLVMAILILIAASIRSRLQIIPSTFQLIVELLIGGLYSVFEQVNGVKTKQYFPILATLFLFILFANWIGLLPGINAVGFVHAVHGKEVLVPFLRSPSADLNTTLALALIAFLIFQYYGIRSLGVGHYLGKFLNFHGPLDFFVGLLELIQELSRVISFAFRLFGNIFAGEVLLVVIASFVPLILPLPFLGFELFVGIVQAFVFAMLTSAFLSQATLHVEH